MTIALILHIFTLSTQYVLLPVNMLCDIYISSEPILLDCVLYRRRHTKRGARCTASEQWDARRHALLREMSPGFHKPRLVHTTQVVS